MDINVQKIQLGHYNRPQKRINGQRVIHYQGNILNLWWDMENKKINVIFIWTPSHCSLSENEKADQAANLAIKEQR